MTTTQRTLSFLAIGLLAVGCANSGKSAPAQPGTLVTAGAGLSTAVATVVPMTDKQYPWLNGRTSTRTLQTTISPPPGFQRTKVEPGSFAAWLRDLPLMPAGSLVHWKNGAEKPRQDLHEAVIDMDVLTWNQQCSDSILRVRGEWLWATGQQAKLTEQLGVPWHGSTRQDFERYLGQVFASRGTPNMAQLPKKAGKVEPGDIVAQPGGPGHAMLVVDTADDAQAHRVILLAQGYMPAQEFHIVKDFWGKPNLSPWYREELLDGAGLETPSWGHVNTPPKATDKPPFRRKDVRQFPQLGAR